MNNFEDFGIRHEQITNTRSVCYIASKLPSSRDEWGNELTEYGTPQKYYFNIYPVSSTTFATNSSFPTDFGELQKMIKVCTISKMLYTGKFKEFDLAYLDGAEPSEDENYNGERANYRIYLVQPQNAIIKIYFLKLVKEDGTE